MSIRPSEDAQGAIHTMWGEADPQCAALYSRSAMLVDGQAQPTGGTKDIAEAHAWAQGRGIKLVRTFVDGPGSGRSVARRSGLQAMMEAARQGEFEVLVVRDLARLGRDPVAVAQCVQQLEGLGVAIWQLDLGEFIDLKTIILLTMNERWSKRHSQLTREGIARAKARPRRSSLDTTLQTLAQLDHPPGWDVVADVRFSADYEYDHSLPLKKYVVYGRDETNANDGSGVEESQIKPCRSLGRGQGWRCVGTYADLGISGLGPIGPALTKLLDRVRQGDIDYVVVTELGRLGVDASLIKSVVEDLAAAGAELLIAHEAMR